jgi:hypothetical protein
MREDNLIEKEIENSAEAEAEIDIIAGHPLVIWEDEMTTETAIETGIDTEVGKMEEMTVMREIVMIEAIETETEMIKEEIDIIEMIEIIEEETIGDLKDQDLSRQVKRKSKKERDKIQKREGQ